MPTLQKTHTEYYFDLPASIYYRTETPVSIRDLVDSLLSAEKITTRLPKLLIGLTGVEILRTELLVNEIQSGSIWEDFAIRTVFGSEEQMLLFADKIHEWAGDDPMSAGLAVVGSLILGGLVVYGAYKAKAFISGDSSKAANNVEIKNNTIISIGAEKFDMSPDDLVNLIQSSVGSSKAMAKEAVGVIKPAKLDPGASISFGGKGLDMPTLDHETIKKIPSDINIDPPKTSKEYFDVDLDVRGINRDGDNGWEALMPPIITRRVKLSFADGISHEDIDGKFEFRADVIVHYTPQGKGRIPTPCEIELVSLVE